jgi:hypothetical protein
MDSAATAANPSYPQNYMEIVMEPSEQSFLMKNKKNHILGYYNYHPFNYLDASGR